MENCKKIKKSMVFFWILAILAMISQVNAAAFQSVTVVKPADVNSTLLPNSIVFNNWSDAEELSTDIYDYLAGSSDIEVSYHASNKYGDNSAYGLWRHETGQTFFAPTDANLGGVAFQLKVDPCTPAVTQDPPREAVAGTDSGTEVFIISLYEMRNSKVSYTQKTQDVQLIDENLLMQWSGPIPVGIQTNTSVPSTAQARDWLKFTFDTGYHLTAGKSYALRFAWQRQQAAGESLRRIWTQTSKVTMGYLGGLSDANTFGTYADGVQVKYLKDTRPNHYPYIMGHGRDMDFAVLKTGIQSICYGCPDGDITRNCDVKFNDYAKLASNWKSDVTKTNRTAIEYFLSDINNPPSENLIAINNAQLVMRTQPGEPNRPARVEWKLNSLGESSLAQSFYAASDAGMQALALQVAGSIRGAISFGTGESSSLKAYTIKIYEVGDANTAPLDPNKPFTLLATANGQFPPKSPLYTDVVSLVRPGDWITFVLPSTVQLTGGHYYAFELVWPNTDTTNTRKFQFDCSDANNPLEPEGPYLQGKLWKRTAASTKYYSYKADLEFAIIGPRTLCVADDFNGDNKVISGDINHDCKVDMKDMDMFVDTWLLSNIY